MGQRLVVTIKKNKAPIMKVYYHWSGYTTVAAHRLYELWDIIEPHKDEPVDKLIVSIIHGIEDRIDEQGKAMMEKQLPDIAKERVFHGGIMEEDLAYARRKYPQETFTEDRDRNYGLIGISETGMDELQKWSEGNAEIDLDEMKAYNEVYYKYESRADYVLANIDLPDDSPDWRKVYDEEYAELEDVPTYDGDGEDLFVCPLDNLPKVHGELEKMGSYIFKDKNGAIYELVE